MKRFSLRYTLLTTRFDQIWFPLSLFVLFIIIGVMRGSYFVGDTARAYLGGAVPLVGGIMAAYAILEDPALELRFATPISAAQTLLERLVPTFVIQAVLSLLYIFFAIVIMGSDYTQAVSSLWVVMMMWFTPLTAMMAIGSLVSLLAARSVTGATVAGLVWLVQIVARAWFAGNPIGQYLLVFMAPLIPDHPALYANQMVLLALSLIFFIIDWRIFHRQERYI
jgi:hypothetical protein